MAIGPGEGLSRQWVIPVRKGYDAECISDKSVIVAITFPVSTGHLADIYALMQDSNSGFVTCTEHHATP